MQTWIDIMVKYTLVPVARRKVYCHQVKWRNEMPIANAEMKANDCIPTSLSSFREVKQSEI